MWSGKDLRRIRLRRKYIYIRKWTRFVKKKERIANEKFHLAVRSFLHVDFSLFRPLEFFVDPKNGDGRNNNPPAMI